MAGMGQGSTAIVQSWAGPTTGDVVYLTEDGRVWKNSYWSGGLQTGVTLGRIDRGRIYPLRC